MPVAFVKGAIAAISFASPFPVKLPKIVTVELAEPADESELDVVCPLQLPSSRLKVKSLNALPKELFNKLFVPATRFAFTPTAGRLCKNQHVFIDNHVHSPWGEMWGTAGGFGAKRRSGKIQSILATMQLSQLVPLIKGWCKRVTINITVWIWPI